MPTASTIQLALNAAGVTIASERFRGAAGDERYWVAGVLPAGAAKVSVYISVFGANSEAAWLAWPQLEAGPGPTPYRRSALGHISPRWPAESWCVGPLGIRVGCPTVLDGVHIRGDRVVARITGGVKARSVAWLTVEGSPHQWRSAVASGPTDGPAGAWHVSGRVGESE